MNVSEKREYGICSGQLKSKFKYDEVLSNSSSI